MDIKQLYNGAHVNSKDYYIFDGKSNVKQTLLKLSQTGVNNQKKQFEQKILKQKCNNGFNAPIWNKTSGYTLEKAVQYGYVKIFKLNSANKVVLEVRTTNDDAISFYKKFGFEIKGTLKDYYDGREDAYKMEFPL